MRMSNLMIPLKFPETLIKNNFTKQKTSSTYLNVCRLKKYIKACSNKMTLIIFLLKRQIRRMRQIINLKLMIRIIMSNKEVYF